MKQSLLKSLKTVLLTIALIIGAGYLLAWNGPTADPVGGNTPAPLNVSTTSASTTQQIKTGSLTVSPGIMVTNNLWSDTFRLGTSAASGSVLTALDGSGNAGWSLLPTAMSKIPASNCSSKVLIGFLAEGLQVCGDWPTPASTANGLVKFNASCPAGYSLVSVNADGSMNCGQGNTITCTDPMGRIYSVGGTCFYAARYYGSPNGGCDSSGSAGYRYFYKICDTNGNMTANTSVSYCSVEGYYCNANYITDTTIPKI